MFLLDDPYVSDFLRDTVVASGAPVLDTLMARQVLAGTGARLSSSGDFARRVTRTTGARLYSSSESSLKWVAEHLDGTGLPAKIERLKDKVRFRELLRDLYPDYVFREVRFDELARVDTATLPKPFVIKPALGFFSLGVHVVESDDAWPAVVATLGEEVAKIRSIYPDQVLNVDRFIIEDCIPGEEVAVDAYFDHDGQPVILNILAHCFAADDDVDDRVYVTSPAVMRRWHDPVLRFLERFGRLAGLTDFPLHTEVRMDASGRLLPIEANPLRFGGWCAVDTAHYAFGINPYLAYLENQRPDWDEIFASREGRFWAIVVAGLPSGLDRSTIRSVDYDRFADHFTRPLELRRIDYRRYPVFAFMIAEGTEGDFEEFDAILHSDLREFLEIGP